MSAKQDTNEAFESWWKGTFGEPKNANQDMTKSVAFHAWSAGQAEAETERFAATTKAFVKGLEKGMKECTCPESQWIGSEPNDSTCELSEEEHDALPLPSPAQDKAFNEGVCAAAEMFESVGMVHNHVYSLQRLPASEVCVCGHEREAHFEFGCGCETERDVTCECKEFRRL